MPHITENLIYQKAAKCWECVDKAILLFSVTINRKGDPSLPDYYMAKNLLRDADGFYNEALQSAKKLLGPPPSYSSLDYLKWRDKLLEEFQILATGQEYESLRSELMGDEFLRTRMSEDLIDTLLKKHFHSQQSGKTKLPNIKARMILERLEELIAEAEELNKQAGLKLQPVSG